MYSYFSELHVELLSRGILEPGERLTAKTVAQYTPWWALGLIRRSYLVLATDHRVILVDHRFTFLHAAMKLHAVESIPWASVQELRLTGLFSKKLRLRGQSATGMVKLKAKVPNTLFGLLAPMRNNLDGARVMAQSSVTALQEARQMAASFPVMPAQGQLPPYAAAPYAEENAPQERLPSYADEGVPPLPPPPPLAVFDVAPLPEQNAPGYSSVLPPNSSQRPSAPPPLPPLRGLPPRSTQG